MYKQKIYSILSLILLALAIFAVTPYDAKADATTDHPVFRFYNMKNGTHFYTISVSERDNIIRRWPGTYRYEGISWYRNTTPVTLYRFYNVKNGSHFFTASIAERDNVIRRWPTTYHYEGVAWTDQYPNGPIVYRFYNLKNGSHFFTVSSAERDNIIRRWPGTYRYEGVAWGGEVAQIPSLTAITSIGAIIGDIYVTRPLTAGAVSPAGATVTYQWQMANTSDDIYSDIGGATASTYTPPGSSLDKYIRVRVTGTGSYAGTVISDVAGPLQAIPAMNISSLSATHALAGTSLTINGSDFGATQGTSTVTFGERVNPVGVAPVSRQATVTSWSNTLITVTVPSMAPGLTSVVGTHHPVYVTIAGTMSNSSDFYMDPVTTLDASSSIPAWQAVFPNSVITKQDITHNNSAGSKHGSYTTRVTLNATNGSHPEDGNAMAGDTHDILIKDANFIDTSPTLNGFSAGVITIMQQNIYSVTFENCVINNNTTDGGDGTGINGVKSWYSDSMGRNGDWTFSNSSFGTPNSPNGSFRRMSIEINEDDNMYSAYTYNVRITGSDFEPPACEPISFNNRMRGPARQYLIDNTIIKGTGAGISSYGSAAFESTGYGLTIENVDVWAWNGTLFNFEGTDVNTPANYYFHDLVADMTHQYMNGLQDGSSDVFDGYNLNRVVLDQCDINMGDNNLKLRTFAWRGPTPTGWIGNSNWDMSTSFIHGVTTDSPNPTRAIDYWRNTWNAADPIITYGYNIATNTDAQNNIYPQFGTRP